MSLRINFKNRSLFGQNQNQSNQIGGMLGQKYAGEHHVLLQTSNGLQRANFDGPGTKIIRRLSNNDQGITPVDNVAKRHDIDYTLAQQSATKQQQLKAIRNADIRMINSLQKLAKNSTDTPLNIQASMKAIQIKKLGENIGILNKAKFSGKLKQYSASDNILLNSHKQQLIQQGLGSIIKPVEEEAVVVKPTPGFKLKNKLLAKIDKEKLKSNKVHQKLIAICSELDIDQRFLLQKSIRNEHNIDKLVDIILPKLIKKQFGVISVPTVISNELRSSLKSLLTEPISGSGLNLAGSGFWNTFKTGWNKLRPFVKTAAKIAAPIALTTGHPILATGLMVGSELI